MVLDDLMKQLSKDMEMEEPFSTEFPGSYSMRLDQDIIINVTDLGQGGLSLTSTLAPCPKENLEAFFTNAMLANLFGQGTKGAVLGLNTEGTKLTLAKIIDYQVDFKQFKDIMEDFINTVDFWRDEALSQISQK